MVVVSRRNQTPVSPPEGPYETSRGAFHANTETTRLLDFTEQLDHAGASLLGAKSKTHGEIRIITHLVRQHLAGQLTTSSSLAGASGLSYGTAIRSIARMKRQGLIEERARTTTGKSVSLHPTARLLDRWDSYSRQCRALVGVTFKLYGGEGSADLRTAVGTREPAVAPARTASPARLIRGRKLRILVHADPTFMALSALHRHFEMLLDAEIESHALSIDRLRAEIIANSALGRSRYDLVACDFPWFGEMAEAGRLLPFDALMQGSGFDRRDFHPDALASTRYQGHQYGIPILMTAEMLVYRTDLLAEAGLEAPTTTAKTIKVARALHRPRQGVAGIAWNGGRGTPLGHTFIMVMGAFGQPILNLRPVGDGYDAETVLGEQMRPMFMTDAARETVEYLRALLPYSSPNVLSMSWYDRASALSDGHAAMAYSHSLLASLFEFNERSPAYRRTAYLPHPSGGRGRPIVPLGGYALAIPANLRADRVGAVWRALDTLTSAQAIKLYTMNGSLACPRRSVWSEPEVRALSPILSTLDDMDRRGLLKMWPRPPTPDISDIVAIAGQEVHDALTGVKTTATALQNAQQRADTLMRARGRY